MDELSDEALEAKLEELLNEERAGLAEFLKHLDDFDRRRLANRRAFPSTFEYCTRKLGLSEDEAYRRIHVARKARSHPELLDKIRDGALSLTAASRLAPSLTEANKEQVLANAEHKTVREVEKIVAELKPLPEPPRDVIKPISLALAPDQPGAPAPEPRLAYRVSITLSDAGFEMLRRATDLLRHKHPRGEAHAILEEALDALLDAVDRDRKTKPSQPRPGRGARPGASGAPGAPGAPGSRHIPEWVKDAVWKRDAGRCAFIARDGRRCEATSFLQYDHAEPFARGGASDDPRNVRLLCAAHNRQAAADLGLALRPPDGERAC